MEDSIGYVLYSENLQAFIGGNWGLPVKNVRDAVIHESEARAESQITCYKVWYKHNRDYDDLVIFPVEVKIKK